MCHEPVGIPLPEEYHDLREKILGRMDDEIADFLYYDRKEDEELPRGHIEKAVSWGIVTADEMADAWKAALKRGLGV